MGILAIGETFSKDSIWCEPLMHDACKQHQGKTTADRGSLRDPRAVGTAFAKKAISHLGCGLLTLPSWRRPRGSQTVREAEQLRIPSISHLG